MGKVKMNLGKLKKKAQSDKDRSEGGGKGSVPRLKLSGGVNKVLILPSKDPDNLYKKVMVHQVWKGKRPVATATCPRIEDGEDCSICDHGFRLREKYEDNKSLRKQNLWKNFMPTNDNFVNALNLKSKNPTPEVLKLPQAAYKLLLSEFEDITDIGSIVDLDSGRILKIEGNGKEGNFRRYEVCKFLNKTANLVEDGKVEEEEIMEAIFDLDKLQHEVDEKKVAGVLRKLKVQSGDTSSAKDEEESEEVEEELEEVEVDDDDDDDDFENEDEEGEEDEDDEDEEGEEGEDDDEDEDDDDEDEEVVSKKRKSKVVVKTKKKKNVSKKKRMLKKKRRS